jgi:predicted TIM-barrel fold metal-dependent hydrolase
MARDDEDARLPIKLDTATNGEYVPVPLSATLRKAKAHALAQADDHRRRLGISRRHFFLASASGAALTLLSLNEAFAHGGRQGGSFALPPEAALDSTLAEAALGGDELIIDSQTHHVNPHGSWREADPRWQRVLSFFSQSNCGETDHVGCFSADYYLRHVFLESDTHAAVLSHVPPGSLTGNPLTTEDAAATRLLADAVDGSPRVVLQGLVTPTFGRLEERLDEMDATVEQWGVRSWKTYTQSGERGWFLDDPDSGIPFIERARALGIKTIAIHKGLPFSGYGKEYSSCRDIGVVARCFPDVNFLVYHAGFEGAQYEQAYDPGQQRRGVDTLVKALADNEIPPERNVYVDLGATWHLLMRSPTAAAHVLGKLLLAVGPKRILWGTDSIWWGSPQDQIQAFRAFEIADALREAHGYPALDAATKERIFGLNALDAFGIDDPREALVGDRVSRLKTAHTDQFQPTFESYGPRSAREFAALEKLSHDMPH